MKCSGKKRKNISYECHASPSAELSKALELLEGMKFWNWKSRRDKAITCIKSAQNWYDSRIIREERGEYERPANIHER